MSATVHKLPRRQPAPRQAPVQRGYVVAYEGPQTRCPGCHRSNWDVRRVTAECAFCACALPIGERL